ncbi:MAG: ABC transporter substrate-binding protein [Bacteroidia bacterium]
MRLFTDQLGRVLELGNDPPKRIVSLLPSQTELLAYLGLNDEVVGITKFCVEPVDWYRRKVRVGGTKDVKIEEVIALQPDLIIANKEENEKGTLEILMQFAPVYISDVRNLDAALEMIASLGEITGRKQAADALVEAIAHAFGQLPAFFEGKKILYCIWRNPWMFAGPDTFIGHLLERLGAQNLAAGFTGRYPEIDLTQGFLHQADCILLSSEPFPFGDKHITELREAGIEAEIKLVDGACFSWYGSRLLSSAVYLKHLGKTF